MVDLQLRVDQKQIQDLRAELYSNRKIQREAQQQREALALQVQDLQQHLREATQQASQVAGLTQSLTQAVVSQQALEVEVEKLRGALSTATVELKNEKSERAFVQEAKERAEADRQRLLRARDDLARNFLAAERRAQDAEEEQLRIEQEARAEHQNLQALESEGEPRADNPSGNETLLLQEIEMERQRAAVLVTALSSAKRERDDARAQLQELQSKHNSPQAAQLLEPNPNLNGALLQGDAVVSDNTVEALISQVSRLKAARSKLLSELDAQVEETERLASENTALTQALMNARKMCSAWENQTNDSLIQIDQLKDLLEESALWQSPLKESLTYIASAVGTASTQADIHGVRPVQSDSQAEQAHPQTTTAAVLNKLEAQLMQERAKAAMLDLHLRGLAAELLRTSSVTKDLRHATLPVLTGIEGQLHQLLNMTASSTRTIAG